LVLLWCVWAAQARVSVIERSLDARLVAEGAVHPVDVELPGRLAVLRVRTGDAVVAGQPLAEIDAPDRRHAWDEARARASAASARLDALERELRSEDVAARSEREAAHRALDEAREREAAAVNAERLAEAEDRSLEDLGRAGLVAELEHLRAHAGAEERRSQKRVAALELRRLVSQQAAAEQRSAARRARLEQELQALRGAGAEAEAAARRLEADWQRTTVRAPVAGRVGRVTELRAGAFLSAGARLAEIVPSGAPRAVARFAPGSAGRLRLGQRAWLRLDAYPWLQHGSLPAVVAAVASEPDAAALRVELSLEPRASLPVVHGLTGVAEVEIERVAPLVLALRAAGAAAPRRH
jgi:adhesin transport system membrane fusion protein